MPRVKLTDEERKARRRASSAAYAARWRKANPEANKDKSAAYYARNRDRLQEAARSRMASQARLLGQSSEKGDRSAITT